MEKNWQACFQLTLHAGCEGGGGAGFDRTGSQSGSSRHCLSAHQRRYPWGNRQIKDKRDSVAASVLHLNVHFHLFQTIATCTAFVSCIRLVPHFPAWFWSQLAFTRGVFECHLPYSACHSYLLQTDEQEVMAGCCFSFMTALSKVTLQPRGFALRHWSVFPKGHVYDVL